MKKEIEKNCPCCSEFYDHGIFTPYRKGRCIAQSKSFVIFPAIGSLIFPYLILEPKFHINSFSKLNKTLIREAKDLLLLTLKKINIRDEMILAEHGENFKSLEHAHIHIMFFKERKIERFYWEKLKEFSSNEYLNMTIGNFFDYVFKKKGNNEYTIIWSQIRQSIIEFSSQNIPLDNRNQFIRRLLGQIVNLPWNWQAYEGIDNIENAYSILPCEKIER